MEIRKTRHESAYCSPIHKTMEIMEAINMETTNIHLPNIKLPFLFFSMKPSIQYVINNTERGMAILRSKVNITAKDKAVIPNMAGLNMIIKTSKRMRMICIIILYDDYSCEYTNHMRLSHLLDLCYKTQ